MDLPPNQQPAAPGRWPVVGERSPRPGNEPWLVSVSGCVTKEHSFSLEQLQSIERVERSIDVHCVTRWSKLQMCFTGVRFATLVHDPHGQPLWTPEAKFVSFVSRSQRAHSTSLPLAEVLQLDPLVAMQADSEALSIEHGGPVRMVVPGKYFYKSVKWLERIEFLAEDSLGYWEAEAGYHNVADPWKEQRYIAASLSRNEIRELMDRRDWSGLDLLSVDASGRDLRELGAERALLRNANFRQADLRGANFHTANLSNASLENADLRDVCFVNADLEGANFAGADLRGANLCGASLFGASFCNLDLNHLDHIAQLDRTTQILAHSLDALTPAQRHCIERQLQ